MANVAGAVLDAMNSLREGNVKQIRCSVSRLELDEALKFSGLTIVGEGENMKIMKVPEAVRSEEEERYGLQIERNLENSINPKGQTPEQQLIEAEAKLSQLENKVYALEGDIAWLVDAMRRIGEQIKRGGV
jgi:hypothetical protein